MLAKLCGLLFTLLTCAGIVCLVYVASIASHESQEDSKKTLNEVFLNGVSGRLLSSVRSGLQQKLNSYKEATATLAEMYKQEAVPGYYTNQVPGNVTATWLASLGIHKAFTGQVVYLTVNYLIPESDQVGRYDGDYWNGTELWGVGGCEYFGYDLCYFVDDSSTILLYNHTKMVPQYEFDGWSPYNQWSHFVDVRTIAKVYQNDTRRAAGFWLPSELFTDPVYHTTEQMAAYALPISFDNVTGKCTAAVKWEYNLTHFDAQLRDHLPTPNSKLIFYDSSVTNGTFLAASSRETPLLTNNSRLFSAIGAESPSFDEEMLEMVVRKLNGGGEAAISSSTTGTSDDDGAAAESLPTRNLEMKVSGWFTTATHYYEATTVEEKFTFVLQVPLADLSSAAEEHLLEQVQQDTSIGGGRASGAIPKLSSAPQSWSSYQQLKKEYSPSGFKLHDFMHIWPEQNLKVVIAVMAATLFCAIVQGVIGCVCGGGDQNGSASRKTHDDFYREHGDELLSAPVNDDCPPPHNVNGGV